MRLRLLLLAAILVLPAAGCGAKAASAPVKTNQVEMVKSYRFDPGTIEVAAGDTVTWTNDDNFTHTVKVEGRDDHKVGKGESVSIRFDKPGSYDYVCTLHSRDMHGTVIVR